jgi:gluconolactonase
MKFSLLILVSAIANITIATPETVVIPSGSFLMGDHHDLGGREHRNDEIPVRPVQISAFHMGKYEITNAQYCAFLNQADVDVRDGMVYSNKTLLCDTRKGSKYSRIGFDGKVFTVLDQKEKHPVTGIRWHGAAAYCNWLSEQEGLDPCYSSKWKYDFSRNGYRLPTEEEWEYAGRGGLHSPYRIFPWGDDDDPAHANWPRSGDPFEKGPEPYTTPIGYYDGSLHKESGYQSKDGSNGYGLYDMAGNVWEWCNDMYSQSSADPDAAKAMPDGKDYHVLRSGNWYNGEWGHSRVSNRNPGYFRGPQDPDHPYYHIGLRIARNAENVPLLAGDLQVLGDTFTFTEGPASDAMGNIVFTDVRNSRIHFYTIEGKAGILRENTGGANGLFFDKDGSLLACEGENGQLTSRAPSGDVYVLANEYNGIGLNKPNDLWIDPKGGVYITDPLYGRSQKKQDGEHVYYLVPDRSKLVRVIDDFVRPNGLIGTPDGNTLYVADAGDGKIWKYAIDRDGSLSRKTFFAPTGSDGMTLDALGNVYITQESVLIYNPAGELIQEIDTPDRPTNVTFGGKAHSTLFITARKYLCSVRMNVRGTEKRHKGVLKIPEGIAAPRPNQEGRRPEGRPDKPWLIEHAAELDTNRDDSVAWEEMHTEAIKAFGLYDQDKDGQLTAVELKGRGMARSAMGGFIKLHAKELDSNGNGIITSKELLTETRRLFDKSDKNRDGKVNNADKRDRNQPGGRDNKRGQGRRQ